MKVTETSLPGVLILEPRVFEDERGFFLESWNARTFHEATGLDVRFVQDNHSRSKRGVLRGLHYQIEHAQGKLVRVTHGEVLDVAVDLRRSSPHFGKWTAAVLSAQNHRQMWVPAGFAHGFLVRSEWADFMYKTTDHRQAEAERSLRWDDPGLGVDWQLAGGRPLLASKDAEAPTIAEADTYA